MSNRVPHWLVYNPDTNSIWERPYTHIEEAKKALQEAIRRDGEVSKWRIEVRYHFEGRGGRSEQVGNENGNEW